MELWCVNNPEKRKLVFQCICGCNAEYKQDRELSLMFEGFTSTKVSIELLIQHIRYYSIKELSDEKVIETIMWLSRKDTVKAIA